MRICLIAPPWLPVPPPSYGGTEEVMDTLATALAARGHDLLVVATGDSGCPVPVTWCFERSLGFVGRNPAAELRQVAHGYGVAEEWAADIVHDHTVVGPLFGLSYSSVPLVTTNHGPFIADELRPFYETIAGDVPVIAISQHQAADAGPIHVAAVIHHGIHHDGFPVGEGDGGYAAFLGRMNPDKGLVEACRIARRAAVPLRIAAKMQEPEEHEFFEAAVRPLLGDEVEYVGEVGGADKVRLLGQASCLLNPIRWPEPFGMVMVEALACGTPVVSRPCGAAPEIVIDGVTGFLRKSDEELVDVLGRVGELSRTACRADVEARFSAERMAQQHVELYERVRADARRAVGVADGRRGGAVAHPGRV